MNTMPPSQIKALIELLGRETGEHAALLRGELARLVKQQPDALQQVIEQDFHSSVPAAFVDAMYEICWEELTGEMLHFSSKINPDLEEGLAIVTRFINPAVHSGEITPQIDSLALVLRPLLAPCTTPQEILETMGRFFFRTQNFFILPAAYDIKDISFGRFLQKKRGSALCLCALYAVCAHRLDIDAGLVDLAGRVLVYCTAPGGSAPLFADPLDSGKILTLDDCKDYIFTRNLEWSDTFAAPLSSRAVIRRFLGNMIFILHKLRDERRLVHLRRYMDILKN